MSTIESPFNYPEGPDWLIDKKRQKRRDKRAAKLGRPVGEWGGKRQGAGRPREKTPETFRLQLNNVQRLNLEELGNGVITNGIQKLIDKYV
jgi:hypothetical protein